MVCLGRTLALAARITGDCCGASSEAWSSEIFRHKEKLLQGYVSDCYLCSGNCRLSGKTNLTFKV